MYGDYEGIILASFLTVISSYFAMWCILNNCLARKNVFKIAKSNGFLRILFLPTMKPYVVEYKKTYLFHSILYWFSLLQAVCFAAFIVGCKYGVVSLWREAWSFLYLICAVLLLGMDILAFFTWDSCYDSQADASDRGRYLDDKRFNSIGVPSFKAYIVPHFVSYAFFENNSEFVPTRLRQIPCPVSDHPRRNTNHFSLDTRSRLEWTAYCRLTFSSVFLLYMIRILIAKPCLYSSYKCFFLCALFFSAFYRHFYRADLKKAR